MLQNLTCSITPPYQHREMKIQTAPYETHSDTNKHCILTPSPTSYKRFHAFALAYMERHRRVEQQDNIKIYEFNYGVLSVNIWHHIYKIQ